MFEKPPIYIDFKSSPNILTFPILYQNFWSSKNIRTFLRTVREPSLSNCLLKFGITPYCFIEDFNQTSMRLFEILEEFLVESTLVFPLQNKLIKHSLLLGKLCSQNYFQTYF